ncbi:hypothetical protein WICPIJ_006900 [Wickerhamomyces pijperi]|uniref:Uncharacterized protein n=1 Tax=Wickerhamomyces pijperi TaxID=599730 RepID=A0A9P8Q0W5_WICPI|nr:hypothetical protein WICPIJ_006900 [Wickerhamomyces pijperi]
MRSPYSLFKEALYASLFSLFFKKMLPNCVKPLNSSIKPPHFKISSDFNKDLSEGGSIPIARNSETLETPIDFTIRYKESRLILLISGTGLLIMAL